MAYEYRLPPSASSLVASMRDLGYSFETAIADLIDNSITAESSTLEIFCDLASDCPAIVIIDNGIGMNMDEVIKNLGTIAKSGTKEFLSKLTGDRAKDSQLIGQFGVGFYSAFIVADKVEVTSRHAGDNIENGVKWKSTGSGEYEIENVNKTTRGTEVVLYLKSTEDQFLNSWHVKHVITKYSDHISLPIVMAKEKNIDEQDKEKDSKVIDVPEEEIINRAIALWAIPKQNIKDEQYIELYKRT